MPSNDVLIYADPADVSHKFTENVPDVHDYCFWTVNGTPRQTAPDRSVLFTDGDRVYAKGEVLELVVGELRFTPLERVDEAVPCEPVARGFTYVG